jgi:hypothetical protein
VGRAVHLAAAALDTRKSVEHLLPFDVGECLEPDLFLLEVEIRNIRQTRRTQVDRQRRQHEVEVLRIRDEHQKAENHQRVHPPVDAGHQAGLRPEREQEGDHQGQDEAPDEHRLARHVVPERRRPHNRAADEEPADAENHRHGERHEGQGVEVEPPRSGEVGDAEAGEELDAGVEGEGREAPVDAQVGEADERAFRDRARLEDDFGDETQEAAARLIVPDMDVVPGAQDEPRARPHLRRERRGEPEHEDAEDPGLGGVH